MRMSLAGTNLPNEQPVNGHVKVLSGHAARRTDERHPTRFMAPMRFKKEMEASHEPGSAGILAGTASDLAARDAGAPRFMASIHVRISEGVPFP